MKVIKLEYPLQINKSQIPALAMALGFFDGVHLGHQQVILTAKRKAKEDGLKSAVMTFDPHPSVVLRKGVHPFHVITTLSDKIQIIADLGIDYLFIVHFTEEFAELLPQEFVDQFIIGLNVKHVVAGFDYTYGRMGKGKMETLPFHSRGQFIQTTIPKYTLEAEKISSTRIRKLLQAGAVDQLKGLIGRYYTTSGTVVHGEKRGRTIGFPTANVHLNGDYILPPIGVYAVRFKVNGEWFHGVCNVGYKPTFHEDTPPEPTIEVYLFEFNGDIYGKEVEVEWHLYLRKEQKFAGIAELVAQIEVDKQHASQCFHLDLQGKSENQDSNKR